MIPRTATALARELHGQFKILAVVGPRQAGKTTLVRAAFPNAPYVNLEIPDERTFAATDPRSFLARYPDGMIIDEVQRCPDLFSYLQALVDDNPAPGQFVLTGSQHFGLMANLTQSLAGRVGFLRLYPFSYDELEAGGQAPDTLNEMLYKGGYPPLYDQPAPPERWLDAYVETYVQRDVRQLLNVRDLASFQLFLRLCAGNVGQLLNLSRIGTDVGIDQKTATAWLSVLEASFLVYRLQPHHRNFRKRLVKMPKLYFYDTGVAARLLRIESPEQMVTHSSRGALFENWAIGELLKGRANRGKSENLFFWRSHDGREIDAVAELGERLMPIEIKSGATLVDDWITALRDWLTIAGDVPIRPALVYGGAQSQTRHGIDILPWHRIGTIGRQI